MLNESSTVNKVYQFNVSLKTVSDDHSDCRLNNGIECFFFRWFDMFEMWFLNHSDEFFLGVKSRSMALSLRRKITTIIPLFILVRELLFFKHITKYITVDSTREWPIF